jgi:hypothetical protein
MIANAGLKVYTPEMEQRKPIAQIEASLSHYGRHYYLKTPLDLKGRGVKYLDTFTAKDLTPQAQHKVGWHTYKVTENAFRTICQTHAVSMEHLLD